MSKYLEKSVVNIVKFGLYFVRHNDMGILIKSYCLLFLLNDNITQN